MQPYLLAMHAYQLVVLSWCYCWHMQVDMFYRLQRLIAEDKARQHAQPSDMAAVRTTDTLQGCRMQQLWLCCRTGVLCQPDIYMRSE